ncbi:hypothetical protein F3Y22_tig00112863pilonHSYRG00012 [Hibiscus syriacus]|uniref:Nudix hydrolase domain-containing protein n=1 Tax=Hibiscus syriacus TaxID=106335 RepID=A0A6A2X4Z1_HIBSY|nr:hypothetical protein F3Y22_tig00112863pilonHSYRG00012 [Hibiscus syriacus]
MQLLVTLRTVQIADHVVFTSTAARKGRHRQRYEGHLRLKDVEDSNGSVTSRITVLMISTPNRDDLVFPKGRWEDDGTVHEAACREALEEAGVKGILDSTVSMSFLLACASPEDLTRFNCNGVVHALWNDEIIDSGRGENRKEKLELLFEQSKLRIPWESGKLEARAGKNCCNMEGVCRGYMFALEVTEELDSWAEQTSYERKWISPEEAYTCCRYDWMRDALRVFLRAIEDHRTSGRAENVANIEN